MHIEWLTSASLAVPKRIIKEHPAHQIEQIAASIQAFGFNDPIAMEATGDIVEGVGRLLAAQKLGLETLPVICLPHLTPARTLS
jgi:ParB family chromosome partitioning protein